MTLFNATLLTLLWVLYFATHSLMASTLFKAKFKSMFADSAHAYRLIYNISATALLLPILAYIYFIPSAQIIHWSGAFAWLANILALAAVMGLVYSLRFYSGMDFMGLTQFKQKSADEVSVFVISPLHRYVRHPWYFFALVLIWTRDMNAHFVLSAVLMTAYFFIGSRLEEQKLVTIFGEPYKKYINKVPGIIPSFKRFLTSSEANKLTANTEN